MAHIPEGVVSTPLLAVGALASATLLGFALKRLDSDRIAQTAMLCAVFFISSLITFPVGPSAIHLLLNGLMGLLLGWAAVPAIFVALLLQLLFFGYGGFVVIGVNTLNMALPALVVALTLRPLLMRSLQRPGNARLPFILGFAAGAIGVGLTTLMLSTTLLLSGSEFAVMMKVIVATNVPLLLIEAFVTASVVSFLMRCSPQSVNRMVAS